MYPPYQGYNGYCRINQSLTGGNPQRINHMINKNNNNPSILITLFILFTLTVLLLPGVVQGYDLITLITLYITP